MDLKFRKMEPADLKQVLKIENETFSCPWKYEDYLFVISQQFAYSVVNQDNSIIALFCARFSDKFVLHLTNLAVKKEFRRKNIGSRILNFIEKEFPLTKLIWLQVRTNNKSAINFYKKQGFQYYRRLGKYYQSPEEDAQIYIKKLFDQ